MRINIASTTEDRWGRVIINYLYHSIPLLQDAVLFFFERERGPEGPRDYISNKTAVVHISMQKDPELNLDNTLVPAFYKEDPHNQMKKRDRVQSTFVTDATLPPPGTTPLGAAKPPRHLAADSMSKKHCLPIGSIAGRKKYGRPSASRSDGMEETAGSQAPWPAP